MGGNRRYLKLMNYPKINLRQEPIKSQDVKLVSCIAERRKKIGLTQRELADKVGVKESTIANWESGRTGLKLFHQVISLCQTLNCSPENLIKYAIPQSEGDDFSEAVPFSEIWELMGTHPEEISYNKLDVAESNH